MAGVEQNTLKRRGVGLRASDERAFPGFTLFAPHLQSRLCRRRQDVLRLLGASDPPGKTVWQWRAWGHLDPEADGICEVQAPRTLWARENSVQELPNGDHSVLLPADLDGHSDRPRNREDLTEAWSTDARRPACPPQADRSAIPAKEIAMHRRAVVAALCTTALWGPARAQLAEPSVVKMPQDIVFKGPPRSTATRHFVRQFLAEEPLRRSHPVLARHEGHAPLAP